MRFTGCLHRKRGGTGLKSLFNRKEQRTRREWENLTAENAENAEREQGGDDLTAESGERRGNTGGG